MASNNTTDNLTDLCPPEARTEEELNDYYEISCLIEGSFLVSSVSTPIAAFTYSYVAQRPLDVELKKYISIDQLKRSFCTCLTILLDTSLG